jgi:BNR/Asp-box repeat
MRRALIYLAVVGVAGVIVTGVASSAGTPPALQSEQAFAQHLQQIGVGRFMTAPAQAALAMAANGNRQLGPKGQPGPDSGSQGSSGRTAGTAKLANPQAANTAASGLPNVRVNNPAEDSHFLDQTTQSETTIGVHGSNVVVGFNDSQQTLLALTAGSDLTGYAYSANGGSTFTDAGSLPNKPAFNNFGDPWLGSDRSGNFYYSNLMLNGATGDLDIGVAKSTDGGKTFSAPTVVSPTNDLFYLGDKDSLAVGPDPTAKTRDNIYVSWDDQFADQNFNFFTGLPVARSTDGGKTWHVTYADKVPEDTSGCSFTQYIGATPAVAPNGTLYVAAEKISVDDPGCNGAAPVFSEWIFRSNDGGQSFNAGKQIATVTETGDIPLGPGMVMRNLEFPSLAVGPTGTVYVAWNDGSGSDSDIRIATSNNGGTSWNVNSATVAGGNQVQPAISADGRGLHLIYYQQNGNNTLDVMARNYGNYPNPTTFSITRVTSVSFPGVFTDPQFDPILAFTYMGDYIANVSNGATRYFAWGDNRDTVTNFLWPQGRHDPNVYFAQQP